MQRTIPEKTIEHWVSQYIAYRFRTKADVWWPSKGEDITVNRLPAGAVKTIQLEVKTTQLTQAGHSLKVDLGQLWDYQQRPSWQRPFYTFPLPTWGGDLLSAAARNGANPAECGYRRVRSGWWFGNWQYVMTSDEIARVLNQPLTAHGGSKRGTSARLATIRVLSSGGQDVTWYGHPSPVTVWEWSDFWNQLARCGGPSWPQLIQLSAVQAAPLLQGNQGPFSYGDVVHRLRFLDNNLDSSAVSDPLWLGVGEDNYVAVDVGERWAVETNESDESRTAVISLHEAAIERR